MMAQTNVNVSSKNQPNIWVEVIIRGVLLGVIILLEKTAPFVRKIHQDEIWLYRNPPTDSYVPLNLLFPVVLVVTPVFFITNYLITKNKIDLSQASLGFTLGVLMNGILTNLLKLVVGRPRPDFFWRCFPDGEMNIEMQCTGNIKAVMEGRKSFPSGHASFSFVGLGFLSLYLMGKLHVFNEKGRGRSGRLLCSLTPLIIALLIAISRTCDYHHHWQDVTVGSFIGMSIAYLCYRQYYPSLSSKNANHPYIYEKLLNDKLIKPLTSQSTDFTNTLKNNEQKDIKWI